MNTHELRNEVLSIVSMLLALLDNNPSAEITANMTKIAVEVLKAYRGRLVTGKDMQLSDETEGFLNDLAAALAQDQAPRIIVQ